MFDIIKLLFDICLLKKAPQDLPYSINLLKIVLIVNIFSKFLLANISSSWLAALLTATAGSLLIALFIWISLFFTGKLTRFCQTITAQLGVNALLAVFAIPAVASTLFDGSGLLGSVVSIALIIWYWIVTGHIIRNALDQAYGFALGLAFLYLLISYQLIAFIS